MNRIFGLHKTQPSAQAFGVLVVVCVLVLSLGSLKFRGIGLGFAGVLFAEILVGHFGEPVVLGILNSVKESGLVLFVFTMGLQPGPGLFAALWEPGVKMNVLAAAIVVLVAIGAPPVSWLAGFGAEVVPGIFAGASVKISAWGTALQTIGMLSGFWADRLELPALACAVTCLTSIVGSIAIIVGKRNCIDRSGMLSGNMSNPPALACASNITGCDAPTVTSATVSPLTTRPRVLCAQVIAISLVG